MIAHLPFEAFAEFQVPNSFTRWYKYDLPPILTAFDSDILSFGVSVGAREFPS